MNSDQIKDYLERLRRKGANTLQAFEANIDFVTVLKTDVGKTLLSDLIERHEHLFKRVASLDCVDAEKQTYIYINEMLIQWSRRIAEFDRRVKEMNQLSSALKAEQKERK